jgi:hypothetical protein
VSHGGLNLSRPLASAVIAAIIVALIILLPQRPGRHPGQKSGRTAVGPESVGVDGRQPNDGIVLPNQDAPVADRWASRDDKSRRRSAPFDG